MTRRHRQIDRALLRTAGALVVSLFLISCSGEVAPRVVEGEVDLSSWSPARGSIRLDGQWQFFHRRLLTRLPPGSTDTRGLLTVPGYWQGQTVGGGVLEGSDFGTYGLTLTTPAGLEGLGLRIRNVHGAAKVFVNGVRVAEMGTIATDGSSQPGYGPTVVPLPPAETGRYEILVQAANSQVPRGGIGGPIWFGSFDTLQSERSRQLVVAAGAAGCLAMIALYHFALYSLRRSEPAFLWIALAALAMTARTLLVDERPMLALYPTMSWKVTIGANFASVLAAVAGLLLSVRALYEDLFPRRLVAWIVVPISGAFALLFVSLVVAHRGPLVWSLRTIEILVGTSLVVSALALGLVAKARPSGWRLFLAGALLVLFTSAHDLARSLGYGGVELYIAPFGMVGFLAVQALLLSRKYARSVALVDVQREELASASLRLLEERLAREHWQGLSVAASGLAHETKNPLGIIRGLAQRIHRRDLSPVSRAAVDEILDQSDRAVSRLGEFLDYARVRKPEPTAVPLRSTWRRVIEVLEPDFVEANLSARTDLDEEVEVRADEDMLLQILLNLVLNAVQASSAGGEVRLLVEHHERAVGLRLEDDGHGIESQHLADLTQPYVTHRVGGHGLGLAVVERLVRLHGWNLQIESTQGVGTAVSIRGLQAI